MTAGVSGCGCKGACTCNPCRCGAASSRDAGGASEVLGDGVQPEVAPLELLSAKRVRYGRQFDTPSKTATVAQPDRGACCSLSQSTPTWCMAVVVAQLQHLKCRGTYPYAGTPTICMHAHTSLRPGMVRFRLQASTPQHTSSVPRPQAPRHAAPPASCEKGKALAVSEAPCTAVLVRVVERLPGGVFLLQIDVHRHQVAQRRARHRRPQVRVPSRRQRAMGSCAPS